MNALACFQQSQALVITLRRHIRQGELLRPFVQCPSFRASVFFAFRRCVNGLTVGRDLQRHDKNNLALTHIRLLDGIGVYQFH